MKVLAVCVLEPDESVFDELVPHYMTIFKEAGYESNCLHVRDEKALFNRLTASLIHVIICDLSFGTLNNFRGLATVRKVKEEFPDVIVIGNTRQELQYQQTRYPTFDIFVDKGPLLGNRVGYAQTIAKCFKNVFRLNIGVEVDLKSELVDQKRFRSLGDRDLLSIMAQITFTTHLSDPATSITDVYITPLTGGRSASDVYAVRASSRSSKLVSVPAVLKISDIEEATLELENYHRYVKWVLPYTWRVDILGSAQTRKYGAICYSFVLSGNEPFDALTYYIQAGAVNVIDKIIHTILSPDMKKWYDLVTTEQNINARYSSRYFHADSIEKEQEDCVSQFEYVIQKDAGGIIRRAEVLINDERFPKPQELLIRRPHGAYSACICHGDLNSDNIIVTKDGKAIFIDFQHTGRGHVYEDFIMFEISVRLNFPYDDNRIFSMRIEEERKLIASTVSENANTLSDYGESELVAQVYKIRALAKENFNKREGITNYLYGVAYVCFSMLRYDRLERRKKYRLVPCILATMIALEKKKI